MLNLLIYLLSKPPTLSSFLFSSLAFISSWEEEMTHNLEKLPLANHRAKHLKIHTDTFPRLKENLRVVWWRVDFCSNFEIFNE